MGEEHEKKHGAPGKVSALMVVGKCLSCDLEQLLHLYRIGNEMEVGAIIDVLVAALAAYTLNGLRPETLDQSMGIVADSYKKRVREALAAKEMDEKATHAAGHA